MASKVFEANIASESLIGFAVVSAVDEATAEKVIRKESSPFYNDLNSENPPSIEIKEIEGLTPLIHRNALLTYHRDSNE